MHIPFGKNQHKTIYKVSVNLVSSRLSFVRRRRIVQVSTWNNVFWNVQVFSQVINTVFSQGVVVVLPRELGFDVTFGGQRLHSLDDVQVFGVDFFMFWLVEVFFSD